MEAQVDERLRQAGINRAHHVHAAQSQPTTNTAFSSKPPEDCKPKRPEEPMFGGIAEEAHGKFVPNKRKRGRGDQADSDGANEAGRKRVRT